MSGLLRLKRPISRCEDLLKEKSTDDRSGIGIVGGRAPIRRATKVDTRGVLLTKNEIKIKEEDSIMSIYREQFFSGVQRFGSALLTGAVTAGVLVSVVVGSSGVSLLSKALPKSKRHKHA